MGKPFTGVTLFSGGGLCELGVALDAVEMIGAVEYDRAIAGHYARVWGDHVICADVASVGYRPWAGVDWLHASPSCVRASVANAGRGETEQDRDSGRAVARALGEIRPRVFTLENVTQYRQFQAFRDICAALTAAGYAWDARTYNAADYGVPQTRKRLFLRAIRRDCGRLPGVPVRTHCPRAEYDMAAVLGGMGSGARRRLRPYVGWLAALTQPDYGADLLPTLPESKFADWQLARLPAELATCIVHGSDVRSMPIQEAGDPCFTIMANGNGNGNKPRAFLAHGTSTMEIRQAEEPSAYVMATVGAKAANPRAFIVDGKPANYAGDLQIVEGDSPAVTLTSSQDKHPFRAFLPGESVLVENQHTAREASLRGASVPSFTLSTANCGRRGGNMPSVVLMEANARLSRGVVVSMTTEALLRFQAGALAQFYPLPDNRKLASTIIGNGVASELLRIIVLGLLGALR